MWFHIHVHDLAKLYLALLESTIANDDKATWNEKGYYLVENGEHRWNDLAIAITKEAHERGFVKSDAVGIVGADRHGELLHAMGPAIWNLKSRARAVRAGKLLGWKATERGLMDEVPEIVASEAQRAGLVPK